MYVPYNSGEFLSHKSKNFLQFPQFKSPFTVLVCELYSVKNKDLSRLKKKKSILSRSVVWAPAFCFEQPGLWAGQSIKLLSAQTLREAPWWVRSGDCSEKRSHSIVYNQKANTVLNT